MAGQWNTCAVIYSRVLRQWLGDVMWLISMWACENHLTRVGDPEWIIYDGGVFDIARKFLSSESKFPKLPFLMQIAGSTPQTPCIVHPNAASNNENAPRAGTAKIDHRQVSLQFVGYHYFPEHDLHE